MISKVINEFSRQIHSPVPFWFLNGHIDEWNIVREFEMMAEKGFSDVVIHPRYGLNVKYLSDGWFEIFGWCIREAKKHDMHVWIYDEFNWPSGTAGMSVMQVDENYKSKYLAIEETPLHKINFDSFVFGEYVIAANVEGDCVTKTKIIDNIKSLEALTGDWRILNCTINHDKFYVDTLSKAAVDCFKHVTYDEYYNRFGDEFGKTIRAVFTDEPSIYWVTAGYDDRHLPYTDDFFQTFEQRYGYSPITMIPYIFYPGHEGASFRADYWEHAGYLFNERYHKNLGDWCREHGVIFTGHNHHEEPLKYQIRFQGNMFGGMRQMDVPGVDHLEKQTLGNRWISIIGHKICSSETHISGKARCMSESFGVMGWDTTFESMKRVVDWQYALGINLLVPHAIFHTISGMTKRECPPSFFYQSPHWQDFDCFRAYVQNLEKMLCGGRHLCKVAVMYPLSGLWSSYQPDHKTVDFEHTDNFLNSLCLELVKNQVDFDLLDFKALSDANLDDKKLKIADEEYEYLLVPSSPYIRQNEVARLTEIAKGGVSTTFFHKSMEPLKQNLPEKLDGAAFVRTEELVAFVEILKRQINDDIQISGGGADEIMAYRREKDGKKITFLLNRSEKHRKVTAMLKDYQDAAVYDQETGRFIRLEGRRTGAKTQVQLRFQPNQSYFIVSGIKDADKERSAESEAFPIEIKKLRASAPFNVASVYHFEFTAEDKESRKVDVRNNPRYIPVNWDPNVPDFTQQAGVYEAEIEINAQTDGIKMIVDKDFASCDVFVNNKKVDLLPCCTSIEQSRSENKYLTDFQDVYAEVGGILKQGKNTLKVVSPTKLSEPLRFIGDFAVNVSGTNVVINNKSDKNMFSLNIDYPFYSGTIRYEAEFELDRDYKSLILNLHEYKDSVAVYLNGELVGKRLWVPYTLDIRSNAVKGTNKLKIEARNNMTNLINGNPRPLGLHSMPTISGFID